MLRVGVKVLAVGEEVAVTGGSVLAGTVGGRAVGAFPPQAVTNPSTANRARAILQTLRVLKTLRVFWICLSSTAVFLQTQSIYPKNRRGPLFYIQKTYGFLNIKK
jgi:hypothetical protein